jgi:hypothetical protein
MASMRLPAKPGPTYSFTTREPIRFDWGFPSHYPLATRTITMNPALIGAESKGQAS